MNDQPIKIEDLTPGTVVELAHYTVQYTAENEVSAVCSQTGRAMRFLRDRIARIISRPETPEAKIARLEAELAQERAAKQEVMDRAGQEVSRLRGELDERNARIVELVKAAHPLVISASEPHAPVQWSAPIEGPPPKGLPAGSYQHRWKFDGIPTQDWVENSVTSNGDWVMPNVDHRIAMNKPITWEGGECPVPGDWWVDATIDASNGMRHNRHTRASSLNWSKTLIFRLTSCGGK